MACNTSWGHCVTRVPAVFGQPWWRATVGSLWSAVGLESSSSTLSSGVWCHWGCSDVKSQFGFIFFLRWLLKGCCSGWFQSFWSRSAEHWQAFRYDLTQQPRRCRSLVRSDLWPALFLLQQRTHRRRPAGGRRHLWSPPSVCSVTRSSRYVSTSVTR